MVVIATLEPKSQKARSLIVERLRVYGTCKRIRLTAIEIFSSPGKLKVRDICLSKAGLPLRLGYPNRWNPFHSLGHGNRDTHILHFLQ